MRRAIDIPWREWKTLDAGEQREALARDVAAWQQDGLWPTSHVKALRRRIAILAHRIGQTRATTFADLLEDAAVLTLAAR